MEFTYTNSRGDVVKLNTFIFKRSWCSLIKPLTDDQAGQLIKAFSYYIEDEPYTIDPVLDAILQMMLRELRASSKRHIDNMNRREKERIAAASIPAAPTSATMEETKNIPV